MSGDGWQPQPGPKPGPPPNMGSGAQRPAPDDEREFMRGLLNRQTAFRLMVKGQITSRELGYIIQMLMAQKAILEDSERTDRLDAI